MPGRSSGMNVQAACTIARELGSGHAVVTFDTGLKYQDGDLFRR